jgi:hypothetical protein
MDSLYLDRGLGESKLRQMEMKQKPIRHALNGVLAVLITAAVFLRLQTSVKERELRQAYRRFAYNALRKRPNPFVLQTYAIRSVMHYHYHRLLAGMLLDRKGHLINIFGRAAPAAGLQSFVHVLRHRRFDRGRRLMFVDRHDDAARVQMQRRRTVRFAAAVDAIAENRPAHGGAMDAQLMRASGQWRELKKSQRHALRGCAAPEYTPARARRSPKRIDTHPPAAIGIEAAERLVDFALVGGRIAFHDGPISFLDASLLEELHQPLQSLAMAAENKASRCVAVEPVRQSGAPRQAEAQRVEIGFQIFAAFRASVDGNAGRLVDDEHQSVAVEQPGDKLFSGHAKRLSRREAGGVKR